MGNIIHVKPNLIRPSQDFLKEGTIKFILERIFREEYEKLPPTPIVRRNPGTDQFIAIDGHNLLAVKDLLREGCDVYVAEASDDAMTRDESPDSSDEALFQRNQDLQEKFDAVLEVIARLEQQGITTLRDLRMKYPSLNNVEIARHFYSI